MMQMHSSTSPVYSVVDHAEDHPTLPSATKTHWTNIEEDELVKFLVSMSCMENYMFKDPVFSHATITIKPQLRALSRSMPIFT